MSTQLNRASEDAHIIAVKNLADRLAERGIKRSQFFEDFSKKNGYADWNTYRAVSKINLKVHTRDKQEIGPGAYLFDENFLQTAMYVINLAYINGFSCDHSAPMIISDSIMNFPDFSKAAKGLALTSEFKHRGYIVIDDLPRDIIGIAITAYVKDFTGIIILDLNDISQDEIYQISGQCPKAIILSRCSHPAKPTTWSGYHHPYQSVINKNSMWEERMFLMLEAFKNGKVDFDTRSVPDLDNLDPKNKQLSNFLLNLPGYKPLRKQNNQAQEGKARENYNFLTMQIAR